MDDTKKDSPEDKGKINFYNIFCKENTKYFGGWYINCDEIQINSFFESRDGIERKFRNLFLYLEAAEVLKKQLKEEAWSISKLYAKQLWYHTVLLLLIGTIDQLTKHEMRKNERGEDVVKGLADRFLIVMNNLKDDEKKEFTNFYFSNKKTFKSFDKVASDIYKSRNFFAHDPEKVYENTPDDTSLSFSENKEYGYLIHFNLSHGKLFFYILLALIRYLGFRGDAHLGCSQEYKTWGDFTKDEA